MHVESSIQLTMTELLEQTERNFQNELPTDWDMLWQTLARGGLQRYQTRAVTNTTNLNHMVITVITESIEDDD